MVDLSGRVLAETYEVGQLLGKGGMGAVYAGTNVRIGKGFAIKVLTSDCAENPEAVQRFRREAQIATDLGHPHIVDVIDFNETEDGISYMVMELLDGEDLAAHLALGPISVERTVAIGSQICSALHAAHGKSVIHRDLKPANVFLCTRGEQRDYVKVLDFGISKILGSTSMQTREQSLLGTPSFMAPEQAEGEIGAIGPWTDVFALGTILYQMVTGTPAFVADTLPTLLYKVVHHHPPPVRQLRPDLPGPLSAAIDRAMAKTKEKRLPSMAALAAALQRAVPDFRAAVSLEGADFLASAAGESDDEALAATIDPNAATLDPIASTGAGEAKEPQEAPGRWGARWVVLASVAVAAVAGVVLLLTLRGGSDTKGRASERDARPAPARQVVAVPDQARPGPDGPTRAVEVAITFEGKPRGARVIDPTTGAVLTTLPGTWRLPRSTAERVVLVTKRGYLPRRITVVPDATRSKAVVLTKREEDGKKKFNPERIDNPFDP